ncbi:MAG: M28 family peptidase [Saprospiraceae bacterium]|nr:M28 family peptidase [Saprospiraceae bacterium]
MLNKKNESFFFAHWDTRLIAEKDSIVSMRDKPIPGAIDGASGVAGLLEIARLISKNPINIGVDFVFFDAEDQGSDAPESWCLGSQFWAKSIKDQKNKPSFGILLDLIGAKGATYGKEAISTYYAKDIVDKVWRFAAGMGKGHLFVDYNGGQITDDHFYINKIGGIPTIDIIETKPSGNFGLYHHTHKDNIDAMDKTNLAGVIQVVTAVVYKFSDEILWHLGLGSQN